MKLQIILLTAYLMYAGSLLCQTTPPKKAVSGNFECEILLDIYDGFFDWTSGASWSGSGLPLPNSKKVDPGAVTVANINDTNGNGTTDALETNLQSNPPHRREIDLIKIAVRKKNPTATLSGTITLTKKSGVINLWKEPTKQTLISTNTPIVIQAADLPAIYFIEATQASAQCR